MVQNCLLLTCAKATSKGRQLDPATGVPSLSPGAADAFQAAIDCLSTTRRYNGLPAELTMEDLQAHLNEIGAGDSDFGTARR